MASKSGPQPQEIEVSASFVENSCGVALDIGGSSAKIVYRCNQLYKGGKLIDKTKASTNVGYLKMATFPREAVDAYLQYIADHADLTGHPPKVNSCGFGGTDYKEAIEQKLKAKLNNLSEFKCFGSILLRVINDSALSAPFFDLDPQGLKLGEDGFYKMVVFQNISDELPMPERSEFEEVINEAVGKVQGMMKENIKLPCLLVMCGSAFAIMQLRKNGTFDCREIMISGGRSFLGQASIMTGEREWTNIKKMLDTHDGSTAYSFREGGDDNKPKEGDETAAKGAKESSEPDPYSTTQGMKMFPFGNCNVVPRETVKDGDLVYTLFETFCINVGTLAFNTALAQDLNQVLFVGSFVDNPLARTLITREIMMRNIRNYYAKDVNKVVDFRFIRNGAHLGAIGAMVNTDT